MKNTTTKDFQENVDKYLIRHRSVLDIMTKYQESVARVNRSLAKSVTECGCLKINATKQDAPEDISYAELKTFMSSHLNGELCPHCKENLEKELGHTIFYMAALCNLTGISIEDVMKQENNTISTLGYYYLS